MSLKVIFTWWNRQTLGTFLKTLFTGIFVGKDEFGNKYYKNKNNQRWIVYADNVEATKITSDWYLWMHHTTDKIPDKENKQKYSWQKKHVENKTGTTKRVEKGQELEKGLQEDVTQVSTRVGSERNDRIKTEENIFQLLKSMVNEAKIEIETERRERIQSEETMLQLLEQTCS